jgi:hypothetical protein
MYIALGDRIINGFSSPEFEEGPPRCFPREGEDVRTTIEPLLKVDDGVMVEATTVASMRLMTGAPPQMETQASEQPLVHSSWSEGEGT